jgi:hypothetical protein
MTQTIYWLLVDELGEEFLVRSRKQMMVVYRCLLVRILRDELKMGWTEICKALNNVEPTFFMHHSSIIHLYKTYEVYEKDYGLEEIYTRVVSKAQENSVETLVDRLKSDHISLEALSKSFLFL